jgi:hypothetical protein
MKVQILYLRKRNEQNETLYYCVIRNFMKVNFGNHFLRKNVNQRRIGARKKISGAPKIFQGAWKCCQGAHKFVGIRGLQFYTLTTAVYIYTVEWT